MEDEYLTETTDSLDSSDSFIASDDDVDVELTWDSDDSRPPGPSPDSDPWEGVGQAYRLRPIRRRRVVTFPDVLSSENDSEETDLELRTPEYSPSDFGVQMASPVSTINSQETDLELRTPEYSPIADPGSPHSPEHPPRSPRLHPPIEPVGELDVVEVVEIPSSPRAQPPNGTVPDCNTVAVPKPDVEEAAQLDVSVLSEGEDASLCTICMCPLTNSGNHRVVCLRCGHIFGQSCVERWIKVGCHNGARRCPTCNKKASLKDIRVLYLPKVVPLDTSERDRLLHEKEELAAQKKILESDFRKALLQHQLEVAHFKDRIAMLEMRLAGGCGNDNIVASQGQVSRLAVVTTITISQEGGCRVLAFNPLRQDMVVSQPSGNTVFAGFGVRMMNSVDWQPTRFVLLHSKAIRDLQFHGEDRDLLLSVSLDQSAKLFDLGANTTVHTFKGEGPLWSCCWDTSNPHLLLLGSQSGKVLQYDRRMTDHYVNMWEMENNKTPVVALASTPSRTSTPFPQGGFLSCRLNIVYSYARQGEKYPCKELSLEGPFMSMRYDHTTQMMLTTSRPSSRSPHTRVCLSLLDFDTSGQICAPLIHTFNCGSSARVMSRCTSLPHVDDSLVVAHNESGRTLDVWSSKRGDRLHSAPIREPVIDLTTVPLSSDKPPLLAALSEKKLTLYKINN